jgi:N6-adenosine-specific RNA methylase IME4
MSLLAAPEDVKEQVRSGEMAEKEARRRTTKARRRAETVAAAEAIAAHRREVPVSVFITLVIDPPWRYDNTTTRGAAEDHYPTMTVDELRKLEVPAADDAHLYLWVTNGFLREGFDLLDVWGFTYKTCLTWVKPHMGLGNWFRSATEHVLFAVKGDLPMLRNDAVNWFSAPRERHSKKPEFFYELVESCSPGPYLEMFARSSRENWSTWGNEA